MTFGLKHFGDPHGLYNLSKEGQLEVLAYEAYLQNPEEPDHEHRGPEHGDTPLGRKPPASVKATPEAWARFRKFHSKEG